METGPLVIYDAFDAGLPVVGSRRGGIAELVQEDRNGLLVDPANPDAWGAALARLCEEPGLLATLRAAVRPARTMDEVAAEMLMLYRGLFATN